MILRGVELVDAEPSVVPPMEVRGVFSTMGCENGRVLLWRRHRERILESLREMGARDVDQMPDGETLGELLRVNGCDSLARLRLVCWWNEPGTAVEVEATCAALSESGKSRRPAMLAIHRPAGEPDPGHKVIARSWWHGAMEEAKACGLDDALIVNDEGVVLESAIANVFARFGRRLVTPPAPRRCLPGVMRRVIIDAAPDVGLKVEVRDLGLDELLGAEELWLSNATGGVLRVGELEKVRWENWPAYGDLTSRGLPAPGWRT